ncbi:hypothetical protein [Pontibaca methylaminivorans]|uniref:Uncharacterized protein n=1 Tax=Pontibaca methylaminivorans TaxID=515897 RepID=A0A1R3W9W0_9RHOB|nr:hypothetical protein [Pontibaca methylaminivorans]SIT74529.1 hypothetical protein SAMN05421849_0173 [Pontibaca methylaminivorans]
MRKTISIPISPELAAELESARGEFVQKFGREPTGEDPIFFDPDCDTPVAMSEEKVTAMIVEAAREAGIREELIYAFEKSGYIVTKENQHLIPPEGLFAHNAAIDEYRRKHDRGKRT